MYKRQEQYHKLERDLAGVKNANCMAHARRHFTNAIKAIGKSNPEAVEASVAYKALVRIGAIYDLEGALKELTPEERLNERQASIKPLVEEFFAWLRKIQADRSVLPKSETAKGINYCLNQEAYLKVFLSDGEVPDVYKRQHEHGVIHRDLRPRNVIFSENERMFKIIDFGVSAFLDTENHTQLTKTGEPVSYTHLDVYKRQTGG